MNWSALLRKALKPRDNRGRIFLWSCLAGLIFSMLGLGSTVEDLLRDVRAGTNIRPVSGEVTLIAIDNASVNELGRFPWPRAHHATLVNELHRLGARRIFFDVTFNGRSDPENDRAFAEALQRLGKQVVLPAFYVEDENGARAENYPLVELRKEAALADITVHYDMFGTVRRLPYMMQYEAGTLPSLASEIAGAKAAPGDFPIDFSLDARSIPTVSAADVIRGTASPDRVAGKDVVIGTTYDPVDDAFIAPRLGPIPVVYLHVLGAETLKGGTPFEYPWPFTFVPALVIVAACVLVRRRTFSIVALGFSVVGLIALPFVLERHKIFIEILPPLFLLTIVGVALMWAELRQTYRLRGTTNAISGLPNLVALHDHRPNHDGALVAARIHNYAAIVATLPTDAEKSLVEEIAKRLTVGSAETVLYQGDEGIFAWISETGAPAVTGTHLDALHTLFRSPVNVRGKQFDLKITFGFDTESGRSTANRFASALVAANEAAGEGKKWKQHDPAKLEDADWKLSLLSQLDAAIDAGDLWVAYQPKLDLTSNQIVGAEALARWTHPEKGPVSPLEFILAAEESNRIDKLTNFVLESAIRAAAAINRHGIEFNMSVNLSGRLIDDVDLTSRVTALLSKHGLRAGLLTLEVTETAALNSSARNLEILHSLRSLGIQISVDDYGTGLSTLDYLQRIPATEIKIDKGFVMGMQESQATKVMVNSTIQLAHSLGHAVVAEGVEDQQTLEELKQMSCDLAQGYHIGRPMTFRALSKRLLGGLSRQAG